MKVLATPTLPEFSAEQELATLLTALTALRRGDASVRLPRHWEGLAGKVADVFNDPQVKAREMLRYIPHPSGVDVPQVASPMRFADAPLQTQSAPPLLGQHSENILAELGYGASDIQVLRSAGAI